METKICKKCGIEKTIDDFNKSFNSKYNKYYIRCECKECQKKYSRNNTKRYYQTEQGKQKKKEYLEKNREIILKRARDRTAKYRESHKEEIHAKNKIYRLKNKEQINKYFNDKYKNDCEHRFKCTIRTMIRMSFKRKGKTKSKHIEEILGCDVEFLMSYLTKTYENNYNEKWNWNLLKTVHIDHKKPLKYANSEEEIKKLCHYTNLQLLKIEDNLRKQAKYIEVE
ncbi:MAG: hypothetical protein IKV94_02845 [Clostridia bacterium]|nr:hypothetical protein [Clostridia bacterium]MBR6517120.1 hypothetical protein [Bacilli bacterium]